MATLQRILIMAGGTGGHVFPGLAIAHYFQQQKIEVHWLGTKQGLEARLVPESDIPLHFITIKGVRGKRLINQLLAPFRLLLAILQSIRSIKKINPDVVIGLGGFVSGPGGIASFLLRKKLIIHEQNAKPGLTNKVLARFANKVLQAFPNTFVSSDKLVTVGNPVRADIIALNPVNKEIAHPPRLLVIGGSLGADIFNRLLPKALAKMPIASRPDVMHQTGEKNVARTQEAYALAEVAATIVPFISEMHKAYDWANVVLCRAGALTITELCTAGLGAILVPYPYAVDDHQTANAQFMVQQKAAVLLPQSELSEASLAAILTEFCNSASKRRDMAKAAFNLRQPDATEKVFNICKEICH